MDINEKLLRLGFSQIEGIGSKTFQHTLTKLGSINALKSISRSELLAFFGVKIGTAVERWSDEYDTDKSLEEFAKEGINFIVFGEENYPSLLKEIYDPPPVIYYKGVFKSQIFEKSISVVGTRKMTSVGAEVTEKLVSGFIEKDFGVVSGMAIGIDSKAHEVTLKEGGYTVAVLGTSVTNPSPSSNYFLYRKILDKGGAIISECQRNSEIGKWSFPRRNRIISGLTPSTLVIEAPEKSGALITAYSALDQNRNVYAIPWSLSHMAGEGCNNLIKESKAKLVTSHQDIFEDMNISLQKNNKKELKDSYDLEMKLSKVENEIISAILVGNGEVEDILDRLSYSIAIVLSAISELELKGLIVREENGRLRKTL